MALGGYPGATVFVRGASSPRALQLRIDGTGHDLGVDLPVDLGGQSTPNTPASPAIAGSATPSAVMLSARYV